MKTTIDIADPILRRAKEEAVRRGTTLKAVIEDSLRETLALGRASGGYRLETHTFGGRGLQPGLAWGDWKVMRDLAYEDRGAIAVDTNILLYAHRFDSPWHTAARESLAGLAASGRPWAIPWPCIHEFLAIATHPRVFAPPTPLGDALLAVDGWLKCPTLRLLAETEDYWQVMRQMVERAAVAGPRVHDARIAALCLQHGVAELWTADRDFGRFSALRTTNPVA